MGFGILTAGYYLAFLVGMLWQSEIWGVLLLLLGLVMISVALIRLSEYEQSFRSALFFSTVLILPALYRVLYWLSDNFLWELSICSQSVYWVVKTVEFIVFTVFQLLLLLAIRRLAVDVDNPRIAASAVRNTVALFLYAAAQLLALLPLSFAAYFGLSAFLLQIVYHVLVGVMLVSCYMRICDAADEDMPLKKSRFAWVNRMREERARREQAAADSVTKYAEDKLKKRRAERERRYEEQNRKRRK